MYETAADTWRGWPRSLNMRDATTMAWRWVDAGFLLAVQALPLPLLLALAIAVGSGADTVLIGALAVVNAALLLVRLLLLAATAQSFTRRGVAYWLAPLADPLAVLRVIQTMMEPSREWRGMARAPEPVPR